ncbi:MAG: hypothetical protein G8237_08715 [Magnetococcales bacterium]|nr:hypothetical protein [Magnetococcales bacterium]
MKKSAQDQWIVDVDGVACHMQERAAVRVEEFAAVAGSKWIITDFAGAAARFLTVDAPARYAEVVAQRRLLESGDAREHARICTHWKRARGKTSTELFFTVVEGERLAAYEDRAHDDPDHHLLFSVHALLYACLRAFSKDKTIVVLFEHDRHVDLLLGRSGQVLAASRVSSYGVTREAKENQTDTVAQEIRALLAESQARLDEIIHFGWLIGSEEEEGGKGRGVAFSGQTRNADPMGVEQARLLAVEWGHNLGKNLNVPFRPLPGRTYTLEGRGFVVTSLPEALSHLTVADAVSSSVDRLRYQARQWLPMVLPVAVGIVALLFLMGLGLQLRAGLLSSEAERLETLKQRSPLKVAPLDSSYPKIVQFADQLLHLKNAPTLQALLHDLSRSVPGDRIGLDQVVVEYDERSKIQITLKGRIQAEFSQASQDHETLVANLIANRLRVVKSDLATDVTELLFTLKLERE